ncbi:MAG TPA: hypothetical protein PLG41_00565 [Leptospiraceae bacterium]|nr:hypothetical protein [Leptospiraceae bacterium]
MKPFLILCILFSIYNCNDRNTSECKIAGAGVSSFSSRPATTATTTSASTSLPYYTSEIKKDLTRSLLSPGKIYLYDKYLYINDKGWGIHIYDNSNPTNPVKFTSIQISGNYDIAVKDGIIFADSYDGLLAIKLNDQGEPEVKTKLKDVFAGYGFTNMGVVNMGSVNPSSPENYFLMRQYKNCPNKIFDIIPLFSLSQASGSPTVTSTATATGTATASSGTGGSLARFAINGDYLYVLSYSQLFTVKISNPEKPSFVKVSNLDAVMETAFLFKTYLMLGSTTGMFIYDLTTPENPTYVSKFTHARSCDPVVAQGNYAYVTLRAGCGTNAVNQLDILDISDIKNPKLVKSYPMKNPFGLGIDNQYLFICDLQDGLMIYDVQNPSNISLLNRIQDTTPYDIILTNPKATLTGSGGVYQYDYTSISNITLISKISKTLPPTSPL